MCPANEIARFSRGWHVVIGSRRLVPMPPRKPRRPAKAPKAKPAGALAPSGLKSWHAFAFLIVTAIAWYYVGRLILFVVAVVLFIRGWLWLNFRFPKTFIFINYFIAALLRSGRRRW